MQRVLSSTTRESDWTANLHCIHCALLSCSLINILVALAM